MKKREKAKGKGMQTLKVKSVGRELAARKMWKIVHEIVVNEQKLH